MSKKTFCDHCDEQLNGANFVTYDVQTSSPPSDYNKKLSGDLCPRCAKRLFEFLTLQPRDMAAAG